ncbi:Prolyl oligopeptidase family protein [compost metagenome]
MQLLKAKPEEDPKIYAEINPIRYLTDKAPPIFLVHGDRDSVVSIEHSWIFRQALVANKTPHFLLQLPFESHGFDVNMNGPGGQKCAFAIRHFLQSVLK